MGAREREISHGILDKKPWAPDLDSWHPWIKMAGWHLLLIPALRRQKQVDSWSLLATHSSSPDQPVDLWAPGQSERICLKNKGSGWRATRPEFDIWLPIPIHSRVCIHACTLTHTHSKVDGYEKNKKGLSMAYIHTHKLIYMFVCVPTDTWTQFPLIHRILNVMCRILRSLQITRKHPICNLRKQLYSQDRKTDKLRSTQNGVSSGRSKTAPFKSA